MNDQRDNGGRVPDDAPGADERSGSDAAEAVETAADKGHGGVQAPPDEASSGDAPVEQAGGDDDPITQARTVGERGAAEGEGPEGQKVPPEEAAVSGGAQSDPGARAPDREAATDEEPADR